MKKLLNDRVALITGGARGIGLAIAEDLAIHGCKIIIIDPGYTIDGNHDQKTLSEKVCENISNKHNVETLAITKDVSNDIEIKQSIEIIHKNFNHIDIVINNAAILRDGFVFKYSINDWKKVIDTNLTGAFNIISNTSQIMRNQHKENNEYNHGRIINIISTAGIWGNYAQTAYASAKAALTGLTRATALDLQRANITCNAIAPFASTRVTESIVPQNPAQEKYKNVALKIKASYIGELCSFLCSDDGIKYSGQFFGVRSKEIFLFKQARPKWTFIRKESSMEDIKKGFENNFDNNLTPLETDLEAFSNEPIL